MINNKIMMKYLKNSNAALNLDEMTEVNSILDYVHKVAPGLQSTHNLFDVCVKLSALILIVATSFTDKHQKKNLCLSTAKNIVNIR